MGIRTRIISKIGPELRLSVSCPKTLPHLDPLHDPLPKECSLGEMRGYIVHAGQALAEVSFVQNSQCCTSLHTIYVILPKDRFKIEC